jgi:hypothetical protein
MVSYKRTTLTNNSIATTAATTTKETKILFI